MNITTLTENTVYDEKLICEHGLSLYIQTKSHNILFDMGQTDAFIKNANGLNVDLETVDTAVLSHGHYDHGGGLEAFLNLNKKAPVYISKYAFGEHYNGTEKYIGLNGKLKNSDRLFFTDGCVCIDDELTLYSLNGKEKKYGENAYGLTLKRKEGFIPDPFLHEQYLQITENGKRILISGCSHNGVLNIIESFRPDIFIGGFHFTKLDPTMNSDILEKYADILLSFDTQYYTAHCTGTAQYEFLKEKMHGRLQYLHTGSRIEL